MRVLKSTLLAATLTILILVGGAKNISWAEAQASTPVSGSLSARDAATSREDITLTNNCIERGKEKIYCLCVTKIFKNEMTLREYRAAVELYQEQDINNDLVKQGYSKTELSSIASLSQKLSSERTFRTLCDKAETYFSAASEG